MKFEKPKRISKHAVMAALTGTSDRASEAVISASLNINDRQWVETMLLKALSDSRLDVRRAALIGLGHIARIHRKITLDRVVPSVRRYLADAELAGTAEDTLDDIAIFISAESSLES